MRILWVKAGGIVPPDTGGRIRSLHILKELARRHSVTVFTYYAEHFGDQHSALGGFSDVVAIPIALAAERTSRDYLQYARALCLSEPHSLQVIGGESGGRLRFFDSADIRRRLDGLMAAGKFDVLICDFIYPAGVIDWTFPCPKILFTHNVEAQLWKQQFEATRHPLKRLLYWREWRTLGEAEVHYARQADSVIAVSEQNRDFFSNFVDPARVSAIPTGVDIDFFRPTHSERSHSMVFTGSMDWMPNQEAMLLFASDILPHVVDEVPDAALWIVGRYPSGEIQRLASPRIHVTGRVEDIRPYLNKAPVYIVPLRSGSGTRIKIFEAMAMGKAVVSTSIGAEGLPVRDGENILLADEGGDFARKIVNLLRDPATRNRLGQAGRRLVESEYSWSSVAERFDSILRRVVTSPAQPLAFR